jgi:hypothetical protein
MEVTGLVNLHRVKPGEYDDLQYIDRRTEFGNPFRLEADGGQHTREESVRRYAVDFHDRLARDAEFRRAVEDLRGSTLGCWCSPLSCHGHVIKRHLDGGDW